MSKTNLVLHQFLGKIYTFRDMYYATIEYSVTISIYDCMSIVQPFLYNFTVESMYNHTCFAKYENS